MNIPGKFDRKSVYLAENGEGFPDEIDRNLSFQTVVLHWLIENPRKFDLIHCHDHQTSFIPFMMKYMTGSTDISNIPTYYTIHNAVYNSVYNWSNIFKFPETEDKFKKILDWNGFIDGFATALKCAWQVNTVSPFYMTEISDNHHSLSPLLKHERDKCKGILNGIDVNLWDEAMQFMGTEILFHNGLPAPKINGNYTILDRVTIKQDVLKTYLNA